MVEKASDNLSGEKRRPEGTTSPTFGRDLGLLKKINDDGEKQRKQDEQDAQKILNDIEESDMKDALNTCRDDSKEQIKGSFDKAFDILYSKMKGENLKLFERKYRRENSQVFEAIREDIKNNTIGPINEGPMDKVYGDGRFQGFNERLKTKSFDDESSLVIFLLINPRDTEENILGRPIEEANLLKTTEK